jgi:hypothetical protein
MDNANANKNKNDNLDIDINELLSLVKDLPPVRRCKACHGIIKSKSYNGTCAYCISKQ